MLQGKNCRETIFVSQFGAGHMGSYAEMGSDGFNRILTGFSLFSRVGVRLVPRILEARKTHDFKGF